jgi:asparagine synthase (glutamine-hydrolysing)
MCGICGQLILDGSAAAGERLLEGMLAQIVHRGPDDQGVYCHGPIAMGMRRLSIIDLAGGQQPVFNEDRSKVVVFNGEIYNYLELRQSLLERGHKFQTQSDTEVIVHLYEEKGERCVEDLNGMFAFALWDQRERTLFLARDRIGIKPLHYCIVGGKLLFGSEINSLLVSPDVDRTFRPEAIEDYFTYFYIPGRQSVYRSIQKLPPATTMTVRNGNATQRKYWQLEYERSSDTPKSTWGCHPERSGGDKAPSLEECAEAYRGHLQRAVRLQLRSDVPLGVFLSGGLDSGSLLAAIAATTNQPMQTFTVSFSDASYDESAFARATATRYGTTHHEFKIGPDDMVRAGKLVSHFGEPFGPYTLVQSHAISLFSRQHIKVALAGDGGDELFGGYPTYQASLWASRYLKLPGAIRRGVLARLVNLMPVSYDLMSLDFKIREFVRGAEIFRQAGNLAWKILFDHGQKRTLLTEDFRRQLEGYDTYALARDIQAVPGTLLQKCMYGDLAMFLPDCVLAQTDRMSMAASQEVRVPILDHELVEFAATVPDKYKIRGRQTKLLVREAMKDLLPNEVLNKRKTGFTTPVPVWIRGQLRDYVQDILSPSAVADVGFLRDSCVRQLLQEHQAGQADHGRRIWSLVNFVLWHRQCRSPLPMAAP